MNDAMFDRFMTHVDVGTEPDACWLWTGCIRTDGYGSFRIAGKRHVTHRLMLARKLGRALGKGMMALHSCRNRHCCNPDHLREGTQVENMADRVRDGTDNRGENSASSKLTEDQVRAIRADPRTQRVIAAEYGITGSNVCCIKLMQTWKHL